MAETLIITATLPEDDDFNNPLRERLSFLPNLIEISYLEANDRVDQINDALVVYGGGVPADKQGSYGADTAERLAGHYDWLDKTDTDTLLICVGIQILAVRAGAVIATDRTKEEGEVMFKPANQDHTLLSGLPNGFMVAMKHWAAVEEAPEGYTLLGSTKDCEVAMMECDYGRVAGTQFHPEDNDNGAIILRNHFDRAVMNHMREAA